MAPRKKKEIQTNKKPNINAYIAGAGLTVEQPITETLESNFMPYAMSIIVSRAIPEIDGFKPSHRKLLYTMYNMGLLNGGTIKSANIVGRTMQLFMKQWCDYLRVTKHFCIRTLSQRAHSVRLIHVIWLMRLPVTPRQS